MRKLERKKKPTLLTVSAAGVSVWDKDAKKVAMAHATERILYMASDPKEPVIGLVAKNPGVNTKFCHVFKMTQKSRAKELHRKVSEAFDLLAEQEADADAAAKEAAGGGDWDAAADGSGAGAGAADASAVAALATIAESAPSAGKRMSFPSSHRNKATPPATGSTTALLAASG